ncbi:MAG: hypothetical protein IJD46_00140, partial [Bacilli bacterium]|nr:hypothetical protein [Bacilli bacterium]
EGSSLYLETENDIDFKVIVKRYNPKAQVLKAFNIQGYRVECCYYTFKDWANIMNYKKAYYLDQCPDMICIYGDDSNFVRFDPVNDKEVRKYLVKIYDEHLFNYNENKKGSYEFKPKRLWNFLLFAYKLTNKSNTLTASQVATMQKAHDLELDKEEFRPLFNQIKGSVNNE